MPKMSPQPMSAPAIHAPQLPSNFIAVHPWHANVEQDYVRWIGPCRPQGGSTAEGGVYFVAVETQQHRHAFHVVGVIVDDENPYTTFE